MQDVGCPSVVSSMSLTARYEGIENNADAPPTFHLDEYGAASHPCDAGSGTYLVDRDANTIEVAALTSTGDTYAFADQAIALDADQDSAGYEATLTAEPRGYLRVAWQRIDRDDRRRGRSGHRRRHRRPGGVAVRLQW